MKKIFYFLSAFICLGDLALAQTSCGVINAGSDKNVCYIPYNGIPVHAASNNDNVRWQTFGSGSFGPSDTLASLYFPSKGDFDLGYVKLIATNYGDNKCMPVTDTMALTFNKRPTVKIVSETSVCNLDSLYLTVQTESGNKVSWSGGSGIIQPLDYTSMIYFASSQDKFSGQIYFQAKVMNELGCYNSDSIIIRSKASNMVNAGPDISAGEGANNVKLSGMTNGTTPITWATTGSGSFTDPNTLVTTYYPSSQDLAVGYVDLYLSSIPSGNCPSSNDVVRVNLTNFTTISGYIFAGQDTTLTSLVHLFKSQNGTYTEVASFKTNSYYYFNNLSNGSYIVLCQPMIDSSNFLPTYYNGTNDWHNATPIIIQDFDKLNVNFKLIPAAPTNNAWKGQDKISGTVSLGNSKNFRINAVGVENANVYLATLDGQTIIGTNTDEFGNYEFNNVAKGKYNVIVDYPSALKNSITVTLDGDPSTITLANAALQPEAAITTVFSPTEKNLKLVLYPNPVKDILTIDIPSNINNNAKISIIENSGKSVFSSTSIHSNGKTELDVQNLNPGFYIIQLSEGNNIFRNKFFKTN